MPPISKIHGSGNKEMEAEMAHLLQLPLIYLENLCLQSCHLRVLWVSRPWFTKGTHFPHGTQWESHKLQLTLQAPLNKRLANKICSTNLAGISSPNPCYTMGTRRNMLTFGDSHGHLCISPCSILIVNGQILKPPPKKGMVTSGKIMMLGGRDQQRSWEWE